MDIEPLLKELSKYIFIGIVSSYGKKPATVVVTRPDQEDRTSAELYVMSRCTEKTKDYWMPDIGEAVLCLLLPNTTGTGPGEGFVLGAHYSTVDAPAETNTNVRSIRHKDGSFVRVDMDSGEMHIHASQHLILTAPRIDIN